MDQSGDFAHGMAIGATGTWALLIDGENVGAVHAAQILQACPRAFAIRHVYGNLSALGNWPDQPQLRVIHTPEGRNSADILLTVEAMKLSAQGQRDFVIVTADGGLTHLVRHLRETGCRVVVMADRRAGDGLRQAGHDFVELTAPPRNTAPPQAPPAPPPKPALADFVLDAVRRAGPAGLPIADLDPLVRRALGLAIGATPEKTWRNWLTAPARKGRFACDHRGPAARVRLCPTP